MLSGALCGLVDPGAQTAAAATVAVFPVDCFGSEQNMLLQGEESGAVTGTLRDLSACAVLDGMQAVGVGVLAVSACDLDKKNGAAAAKHETASVLLQVDCAAAARCLAAAVAAFCSLYVVLVSWPGKLNSGVETDRMCVVFESCPIPETDAFSWGHDWKGVSKDKEREVPASFEFTQTKDVQLSSFGT